MQSLLLQACEVISHNYACMWGNLILQILFETLRYHVPLNWSFCGRYEGDHFTVVNYHPPIVGGCLNKITNINCADLNSASAYTASDKVLCVS